MGLGSPISLTSIIYIVDKTYLIEETPNQKFNCEVT